LLDGSPTKVPDEKLEELQIMSLSLDGIDFDFDEE
jgi:hypothetical protein